MFLKNKNFSMFHRLLASSLVFTFSIMIAITLIFYYAGKASVYNKTKEEIKLQISQIDYEFHKIENELIKDHTILAENPIVDSFITSSRLNYEINERALEKLFKEYILYSRNIKKIYMTDYLGKEKISVAESGVRIRTLRDLSGESLFGMIESDTKGICRLAGPYIDERSDVILLSGANVIDGDIGEFGGGVFIDYSLKEFLMSLDKFMFKGEGIVWIFSSEGKVLKQPKNIKASLNPKPFFKEGLHESPEFLMYDEGMLVYKDLPIISGNTYLRAAISVPSSLMLEDIRNITRFSVVVFIIFTLIIVLTVFFQSKRFSRPIIELSIAASKLAKGNLSAEVTVKAGGEVGMLVDSFNNMAKDIRTYQDKIFQRNEELDAANEELAAANEELAAANEELASINEMLDDRVEEQTRKLKEAQKIAKLGSWEWDMITNKVKWSDIAFEILELDHETPLLNFNDFMELVYYEDRPLLIESAERMTKDPYTKPKPIEYRVVLKNGKVKNLLDIGVVEKDGSGKPVRMIGTIQDVTERKQADQERENLWQQLQQAQKMESIGMLSGRIAHDFNNMLTPIVGYSSILYDMLESGSSQKDMAKRIYSSSYKASRLIDQLLTFSRKQVFEKKAVNLQNIIIDMKDMLTSLVGEDIELGIVTDSPISNILGDRTQIQQVLLNLSVNARQAMPDGGSLTIKTENAHVNDKNFDIHKGVDKGDYVVLSVKDTGVGMDPELKMRIFDPFFTSREKEKGTGLGLSTVYGIVMQHNGYILVDSEPGKGSVFNIYFPVYLGDAEEEKIKEEIKEEETEDISLEGGETVFVIDDKPVIHQMIKDILLPKGYVVKGYDDPYDALSKLSEHDGVVDLLLTDVVMPGMNGWELYQKATEARPGIKVLFISGFVESSAVLNDIQSKEFIIIKKPINPKELLRKVRKVLDKKT